MCGVIGRRITTLMPLMVLSVMVVFTIMVLSVVLLTLAILLLVGTLELVDKQALVVFDKVPYIDLGSYDPSNQSSERWTLTVVLHIAAPQQSSVQLDS